LRSCIFCHGPFAVAARAYCIRFGLRACKRNFILIGGTSAPRLVNPVCCASSIGTCANWLDGVETEGSADVRDHASPHREDIDLIVSFLFNAFPNAIGSSGLQ
jgi:hypothetical protein